MNIQTTMSGLRKAAIVALMIGEDASASIFKHLSEDEWVQQCQKFIDQYLAKYTGVKRFVNQGKRLVQKDSQLENYFGRVRHLPNANATKILGDKKLFWMEARAQRQGVNFLIQGTAADLFKIAVVRTDKILRGKKSRIVNLVHDEIQMYIHKSELDLLPHIKHAMEDWHFTVPILADFSEADPSWGKKKGLEVPDLVIRCQWKSACYDGSERGNK